MFQTKQILKYLLVITIILTSFRVTLFSLKFILGNEFPIVVVDGRSMEQTFYNGELLMVKGVENKSNVKLLDIIVFYEPYNRDRLLVHRVVQIVSNNHLEFITKGDNNISRDPWRVQEGDIIGIVIGKAPVLVGSFVMIIQSPIVTILMIGVLVVEYFSYKKEEKIIEKS